MATDHEPDFDRLVLHRISLRHAHGQGARLNIYFDEDHAIRVVESGIGHGDWEPQVGATASRAEVFRAARRALRDIGVDPASGTLRLAAHSTDWYLTFDRTIAGYPVANAPMAWWLDGDKAYLTMRADGSLRELYAIRPAHRRVPGTILDRATLDRRLAKFAKVSAATLATYDRGFLWVRTFDPETGHQGTKLSLSYCATHRWHWGWEAWCVDAATGAHSAHSGAVD